jgi:ribosomal protein L11 methyltransferase
MKWRSPLWRIRVRTTREAEDAVAELLGQIPGCKPTTYTDLKKGTSSVSAYFTGKAPSREVCKEIRQGLKRIEDCGLKIEPASVSISKIRAQNWAESWRRHFPPIKIGGSLLIKPGWNQTRASKGQAVVILDPGLSFGTGQHPTTAFCLREIVRCRTAFRHGRLPPSLLDLGAGSGILAIAAAKLGFQPIRAIDFDSDAVRISRANARRNRVSDKIRIGRGDVSKLGTQPLRRFDVVCANLTSNLLIAERKKIAAQLKPGAVLILAGILKGEFADVQKVFENCGFRLLRAKSERGWRSGIFRLNSF